MRNKHIPDKYVGDTHMTNWFIKHLGMVTLQKVFVDIDIFTRDELKPLNLDIVDFYTIYLVFSSHTVRMTKYSSNSVGKDGLHFEDLG